MRFIPIFVICTCGIISACSGGGSTTALGGTCSTPSIELPACPATGGATVSISGLITYDRVPHASNGGLDYLNTIHTQPARGVTVQAINTASNCIQTSTAASDTGNYTLTVPANTSITMRVIAALYQSGTPSWDFKVVDNTCSNIPWSMSGNPAATGTNNETRDLHAPSGASQVNGLWQYTDTRVAAPFAIIDSVYDAKALVLTANSNLVFPAMNLGWSPKNTSVSGEPTAGKIGTSSWNGSMIYLLGDADNDTDEYDYHVIIHEFGHYVEDKFSRSDSIGGSHGDNDRLDPRVAFGEGFGNAFSAMGSGDPIYKDSKGAQQSKGSTFDIDAASTAYPGWFSEPSIQKIIYDLYLNNNSGSAGFSPIYTVLVNDQRTTPALTTLFPFINAFKTRNASQATTVNTLLTGQSIDTIIDDYGSTETHAGSLTSGYIFPIYSSISSGGGSVSVCTTDTAGVDNKLGNYRYLKFTASAGSHTITVTGDNSSDPDIYLHKSGLVASSSVIQPITETLTYNFTSGTYIIEVYDVNLVLTGYKSRNNNSCLSVTIN